MPNNFQGVAIVRLNIKGQKPNLPKSNNFGMTLSTTFNILQYMHINVGNNNMHNIDLFVTSLRVKGELNEPQQFFVQPKAFEPLMLET